jgi:hypothetical protein
MAPYQETADTAIPELARLQRNCLVVGAAAGGVSLIGLLLNPTQFFQSYLMAYMWCLGATLGCLALGMLHQLSGGAWGVLIRRPIGAASRVIPALTVFFLPIVFGMPRLYSWVDPQNVAQDEVLQHKHLYLNVPFFLARAALYFLVWNALVFFLNRWSLEQDTTGDPRLARRMQRLSAGGLFGYGLTITFASFDWLMSLDPHWYSTIYGVIVLGGQGLTALAVLTIALVWLSRRPPLERIVQPSHFHDLGNLMLAFTMLWAYFSFSQYLIIWSGNLPHEIEWYLYRSYTSWRLVAFALVAFHFAIPFILLLSRALKRHADTLVKVATWILFARLIDLLWLVAPEFHHDGLSVSWMDATLPLALGGLWAGAFIRQLRGRAILPVHDPQFDETLGPIIERSGRSTSPRAAH